MLRFERGTKFALPEDDGDDDDDDETKDDEEELIQCTPESQGDDGDGCEASVAVDSPPSVVYLDGLDDLQAEEPCKEGKSEKEKSNMLSGLMSWNKEKPKPSGTVASGKASPCEDLSEDFEERETRDEAYEIRFEPTENERLLQGLEAGMRARRIEDKAKRLIEQEEVRVLLEADAAAAEEGEGEEGGEGGEEGGEVAAKEEVIDPEVLEIPIEPMPFTCENLKSLYPDEVEEEKVLEATGVPPTDGESSHSDDAVVTLDGAPEPWPKCGPLRKPITPEKLRSAELDVPRVLRGYNEGKGNLVTVAVMANSPESDANELAYKLVDLFADKFSVLEDKSEEMEECLAEQQ